MNQTIKCGNWEDTEMCSIQSRLFLTDYVHERALSSQYGITNNIPPLHGQEHAFKMCTSRYLHYFFENFLFSTENQYQRWNKYLKTM